MEILAEYLWRFGLNLSVVSFIVLTLYRRRKPSRTYVVALIVGAELIYIIITLMVNMEIGLGVGFGIFAIFSLLRFRTVAISLRDMTYLFAVFTLSLANALLMNLERWEEIIAINSALLLTLYVLDSGQVLAQRSSLKFILDDLELLQPANRMALWSAVQEHGGVEPIRITVDQVDASAKQATLKVYYEEGGMPENGEILEKGPEVGASQANMMPFRRNP